MDPYRLVIGLGGFGSRVVEESRAALTRRRDYWGDPTEYLVLTPRTAKEGSEPPPSTRAAARRELLADPCPLYERLKQASERCIERTRKHTRERGDASAPRRAVDVYVAAALCEPWASGVLLDLVSLARCAVSAPWEVRVVALLSTATVFSSLEREVTDKANVYAALRELEHLARGGFDDFEFNYGPCIPPPRSPLLLDLCYLFHGESPSGTVGGPEAVLETMARFLTGLTTSEMGELILRQVAATPEYKARGRGREGGYYSAVGVSCSRVPLEALRRHCARRLAAEIASEDLLRPSPAQQRRGTEEKVLSHLPLSVLAIKPLLARAVPASHRTAPRPSRPAALDQWGPRLRAAHRDAMQRLEGDVRRRVMERADVLAGGLAGRLERYVDTRVKREPSGLVDSRLLVEQILGGVGKLQSLVGTQQKPPGDAGQPALRRLEERVQEHQQAGALARFFSGLSGRSARTLAEAWDLAVREGSGQFEREWEDLLRPAAAKFCEKFSGLLASLLKRLRAVETCIAPVAARFSESPALDLTPRYPMDELNLAQEDFDAIYRKKARPLRSIPSRDALLRRLIQSHALYERWPQVDSQDLYDRILKFCWAEMDVLEKDLDLETFQILKDPSLAMGKKGMGDALARLSRLAEPLWPHPDESLGAAEGSGEITLVGAASGSGFRREFPRESEGRLVAVPTREPHRLYLFRTFHGLRLDSAVNMKDYRARYESLPESARAGLHLVRDPSRLPPAGG